MKKKCRGMTVSEALVVIAILFVVAAALFPIFNGPDMRPIGRVLDGANNPIPGATLRFRDGTGKIVAVLKADDQGEFRQHGLGELSKNAVDGFILTHVYYPTGGRNYYYFSPLGSQEAIFHDAQGRLVTNLAVFVQPDLKTWRTAPGPHDSDSPEPPVFLSDGEGVVRLQNVPMSARFNIQSGNDRYIIQDVKTIADSQIVRYEVTVLPPATITGCVRASNGKLLHDYSVFAEQVSSPSDLEGTEATATANQRERFRLTGLQPGTYDVGTGFPTSDPPRPWTKRVTIATGQTIDLTLQAH